VRSIVIDLRWEVELCIGRTRTLLLSILFLYPHDCCIPGCEHNISFCPGKPPSVVALSYDDKTSILSG
jgi:hypothetical protein